MSNVEATEYNECADFKFEWHNAGEDACAALNCTSWLVQFFNTNRRLRTARGIHDFFSTKGKASTKSTVILDSEEENSDEADLDSEEEDEADEMESVGNDCYTAACGSSSRSAPPPRPCIHGFNESCPRRERTAPRAPISRKTSSTSTQMTTKCSTKTQQKTSTLRRRMRQMRWNRSATTATHQPVAALRALGPPLAPCVHRGSYPSATRKIISDDDDAEGEEEEEDATEISNEY